MPKSPISASDIKMADMLRSGVFSIPMHQRLYDWDEEQVGYLLDDLGEAVDKQLPCHFLGPIMLVQRGSNESKLEINDGQQRIVTYSLLCACLCRRFHERGQRQEVSDIIRILFDAREGHGKTLDDAVGGGLSPRVKIPMSNKQNYDKLISNEDISTNGKMVIAWNTIDKFLNENSALEWQKKLLDFLLNKIIIVKVAVSATNNELLDINAIFETLNNRGKSLSQIDLIKNYFLSCFNDDNEKMKTVNECMEQMYTLFRNNVGNVEEYVRCFLQMRYGFINAQRFFKAAKTFLPQNPEHVGKIYQLVGDMSSGPNIEMFRILLRRNINKDVLDKITSDAGKKRNIRKIQNYLLDMRDYKITRPIIFSLLSYYSRSNAGNQKQRAKFVYSCTKILSSFIQRVAHTQGAFRPSEYEEKFADIARDITSNRCNTADAFYKRIKECDNEGVVDDTTYMNLMRSKLHLPKVDTKYLYILRRILEYVDRTSISEENDSLEHIFPKGRQHHERWNITPDDAVKYVHCLGNLTLIHKNDNKPNDRDNASFSAKKTYFSRSEFSLTRELCEVETWDARAITKRQAKYVKIMAREIWNFNY